jgi:hypothetical protein
MSNETKPTEQDLLAEIARLKEFKSELIYLVDRFGGDGPSYCNWNIKEDKKSAKEWADIVYKAANDLSDWEKTGVVYRTLEKIKE